MTSFFGCRSLAFAFQGMRRQPLGPLQCELSEGMSKVRCFADLTSPAGLLRTGSKQDAGNIWTHSTMLAKFSIKNNEASMTVALDNIFPLQKPRLLRNGDVWALFQVHASAADAERAVQALAPTMVSQKRRTISNPFFNETKSTSAQKVRAGMLRQFKASSAQYTEAWTGWLALSFFETYPQVLQRCVVLLSIARHACRGYFCAALICPFSAPQLPKSSPSTVTLA